MGYPELLPHDTMSEEDTMVVLPNKKAARDYARNKLEPTRAIPLDEWADKRRVHDREEHY